MNMTMWESQEGYQAARERSGLRMEDFRDRLYIKQTAASVSYQAIVTAHQCSGRKSIVFEKV